MAKAPTLTVLFQAEIFRFLFKSTFLKLKNSQYLSVFMFQRPSHRNRIQLSINLWQYKQSGEKMKYTCYTKHFLTLCFYIKQLSNNTWRKKKKVCSPRHLRSLSPINSHVHVLTWMSRKCVRHVTLLRTLHVTVAAIFQPLTAQLIYSTECSIKNPTNKRCLTKTRDSI